jgi:hypothetical protein
MLQPAYGLGSLDTVTGGEAAAETPATLTITRPAVADMANAKRFMAPSL